MEQHARFVEPCTGAYDARHIRSVLRYLHSKATGLDAVGRAALLERASRLPGLGGCFIEHQGGFVFRPNEGRDLVLNAEEPRCAAPVRKGLPDR